MVLGSKIIILWTPRKPLFISLISAPRRGFSSLLLFNRPWYGVFLSRRSTVALWLISGSSFILCTPLVYSLHSYPYLLGYWFYWLLFPHQVMYRMFIGTRHPWWWHVQQYRCILLFRLSPCGSPESFTWLLIHVWFRIIVLRHRPSQDSFWLLNVVCDFYVLICCTLYLFCIFFFSVSFSILFVFSPGLFRYFRFRRLNFSTCPPRPVIEGPGF